MKINFTRQQVEFINRHFPEVIGNAETTHEELRFRQGQRSVVAFINIYADRQEDVPRGIPE